MGIPLIDIFCALFDCQVDALADKLSCPFNREKADSMLKGSWVLTTHKNRHGSKHLFRIDGLSIQDAKHLKAYKGFLCVTIMQHFYVRHRIRLRHFNLPCVIENTCYGDFHYYPIELLEIVGPVCFIKKNNNDAKQSKTSVKSSKYGGGEEEDDDDNDKLAKCFSSLHL